MIAPSDFCDFLQSRGIRFYTGVPDSLMSGLCNYLSTSISHKQHVIAANEGSAIALAAGHYLASGNVPLVYMQNAGLGNAINPLLSLAAPEVSAVPMLCLIGWRGEMQHDQQIADEPQHRRQGAASESLLNAISIPYQITAMDRQQAQTQISALLTEAKEKHTPVALLVRKNTFENTEQVALAIDSTLSREKTISYIASALPKDAAIIATTGMISRELAAYYQLHPSAREGAFYCVGAMGHALQIATGIAISQPNRQVYCLDGDGALLMHMGGMSEAARHDNICHILLNNGVHDSVGGQPTRAMDIDLVTIAKGMGYGLALRARDEATLKTALKEIETVCASSFLEIHVRAGHRPDLPRPYVSPAENTKQFKTFLSQEIL